MLRLQCEEHLADLHGATLLEIHLVDEGGDARDDFYGLDGHDMADIAEAGRDILLDNRCHNDRRRGEGRISGRRKQTGRQCEPVGF